MKLMKICLDCQHCIIRKDIIHKTLQGNTIRQTVAIVPSCSKGGLVNPIDGELFTCAEVRQQGVVGYSSDGLMNGLVSCTPAGCWWEPR